MRVLLFTLEYPPFKGGVANVYGNIVKHWPNIETRNFASNNIFILHNNDGKLINNKLPVLKWLPAIFQLWKIIKKEKVDYVLAGHILPLGAAAYIVSKFTKIKYSVILHGMDLTLALKSGRKKWLAKRILETAENIICMNSYVAGSAKELAKEAKLPIGSLDSWTSKVKVVNPGINKELRITNYKLRINLIKKYNLENKIILLSVGRMVKRKGFDRVIDSLPEVLKIVPDLIYVILGNGPEIENLKLKIKNSGLKENIIIITNADDSERDIWYNASDIFIMPSRNIDGDFEGFGIVFLEANLAGKPVIAGNSGGVGDAVKNNVNGLLVNPESAEEIKNAIIKLAKDKELRKKLGEQGRERAVRGFNWEKQVGEIYSIINFPDVKHAPGPSQEGNK